MVALYSFENFFCTYWFISEVLPTLQEKRAGKRAGEDVSTSLSTAVHARISHNSTLHQCGEAGGSRKQYQYMCRSAASALIQLLLLHQSYGIIHVGSAACLMRQALLHWPANVAWSAVWAWHSVLVEKAAMTKLRMHARQMLSEHC
jgi:hypothetical protein